MLHSRFGLEITQRYRSKSGEGWHIRGAPAPPLRFHDASSVAKACLGSDRKRESLALMMAADGEKDPSYLFKAGEGGKVMAKTRGNLKISRRVQIVAQFPIQTEHGETTRSVDFFCSQKRQSVYEADVDATSEKVLSILQTRGAAGAPRVIRWKTRR